MYSVFIDDEMRDLIPALLPEEYELLRSSIIAEGCRDAILVWNGMIVDGHNRYRICTECGIEYETKEMAFDNRQDAILWILRNQLGRRNLNAWQRSQIALKMEPMIAEKAKQQQLSTLKQNTTVLPTLTKRTDPIDTRSEIATIANVSTGTMAKVKKIINTATPETIQKLNAGEITINQAYKDVKREDNMSKTESLAKEIRGQEWLTSIIASAKDHHDLEATLLSINDSIPVNRLKLDLSGIDYRLLHETLTRKQ